MGKSIFFNPIAKIQYLCDQVKRFFVQIRLDTQILQQIYNIRVIKSSVIFYKIILDMQTFEIDGFR